MKAGIFDDDAEETTAVSVIAKQVRSGVRFDQPCRLRRRNRLAVQVSSYRASSAQGRLRSDLAGRRRLGAGQVQETYITVLPMSVQALGVNCDSGVFYARRHRAPQICSQPRPLIVHSPKRSAHAVCRWLWSLRDDERHTACAGYRAYRPDTLPATESREAAQCDSPGQAPAPPPWVDDLEKRMEPCKGFTTVIRPFQGRNGVGGPNPRAVSLPWAFPSDAFSVKGEPMRLLVTCAARPSREQRLLILRQRPEKILPGRQDSTHRRRGAAMEAPAAPGGRFLSKGVCPARRHEAGESGSKKLPRTSTMRCGKTVAGHTLRLRRGLERKGNKWGAAFVLLRPYDAPDLLYYLLQRLNMHPK